VSEQLCGPDETVYDELPDKAAVIILQSVVIVKDNVKLVRCIKYGVFLGFNAKPRLAMRLEIDSLWIAPTGKAAADF
jgi:hypothetical protein